MNIKTSDINYFLIFTHLKKILIILFNPINPDSMELALKLIREAKEQRLTRLDLGNCGLTELPDELFELTWLEELILSNEVDFWGFEESLDFFQISQNQNPGKNNKISCLNPKIKLLIELRVLFINGEQEYSWDLNDFSTLKFLKQLKFIELSSTQISDLSFLNHLTELEELHLTATKVEDLRPLKNLHKLKKLSLASAKISDIKPLMNLPSLQTLNLYNTRVNDLNILIHIKQLEWLRIAHTDVIDLSPLNDLVQLQYLDVNSTNISNLNPLKGLLQLQHLKANNTQVYDLSPLNDLSQLQLLEVQNCKIKNFESIIPFLDKKYFPKLEELKVWDNPINDVEEKYLGEKHENNLENLRKFYKQWQKGERRKLYEAKLILVGEGAVGKTSLKQKFKTNNKYVAKPNKTPSTEGILYEPWDLKNCLVEGKKRDVRINIWDFGGQEVDHQTHQFFLSRSSFYIYVSNSRLSDAQSKFDYWLNIIHKLAPDSPILLVRNLFDNQTEPYRFNEWLKKYPDQISSKPITIDCTQKNDSGVNEVLAYLKTKISELDSVGKIWPKSYADIREDLERLAAIGTNYIEESQYLDICKLHEIDNEEAKELSRTLHSIGTILHYQDYKDMEELKDWMILKPEWVTKAFYRIVRNSKINQEKGKFNKEQLKTIWWKEEGDKKSYPLSIFNILIDLMKAFDLCFQIQDKKEYIVPQLLNEEENEEAKLKIEGNDVLRFEYHYNDVIPAGMVSRFICKQHNNIPKEKNGSFLYWRYGVLIERENTFALVEQPIGDKKIKITVKGNAKRELLAIVRNAFEDLHKPLNNLKPDEVLPCNCSICKNNANPFPFKYEIIKRRLHEEEVFERCNISDEKIDRRQLFNDTIDESFMNVEKIRNLIAEGKLEKAVSYLNDKNLKTLLGGQLSHLEKQELLGLIDTDVSMTNRNKISLNLLKVLSKRGKSDILKEYDFIPEIETNLSNKNNEIITRKTIKIFLASSNELESERKVFELHFGARKRKTFAYDLEVVLWEDFIDAMSQTRLQDEYNKAIKECDIFVMLFFSKVGMYTGEEFEKAFGHFKEKGKPLIYTYFKEANLNSATVNRKDANSLWDFQDKLKELGHFSTHYKDENDLNFQFSNQLDKLLKENRI